MRRLGDPLISFAAPLLICLGSACLMQNKESNKIQSLPPIFMGCGFIVTGFLRRSFRRKMLLLELKNSKKRNDF